MSTLSLNARQLDGTVAISLLPKFTSTGFQLMQEKIGHPFFSFKSNYRPFIPIPFSSESFTAMSKNGHLTSAQCRVVVGGPPSVPWDSGLKPNTR